MLLFVVRESPLFRNRLNGDNFAPAISGDGRYILFSSYDSGLASDNDTECPESECLHVYLEDRETGSVNLIHSERSPRGGGMLPPGVVTDGYLNSPPIVAGSGSPLGAPVYATTAISADGRYGVFASLKEEADPSAGVSLFRTDLQSGELVELLPETPATYALNSSISADGRLVSFWATASFLEEDGNDDLDLYVRDLDTKKLELISVDPPRSDRIGFVSGSEYSAASFSDDGRLIVFSVDRFLPGFTNPRRDVFVKDRVAGQLSLVSASRSGEAGDQDSRGGSVSGDGRYVVFESVATNLVPDYSCDSSSPDAQQNSKIGTTGPMPRPLCTNVFLKDLGSGEIRLISRKPSGEPVDNASASVISRDGRYVAYTSVEFTGFTEQEDMLRGIPPFQEKIHVVAVETGEIVSAFPEREEGDASDDMQSGKYFSPGAGISSSQGLKISADGRFVVFGGFSSRFGLEDRMCEPIFYGGEAPEFLNISPPQTACLEVLVKDVDTGELSRVAGSA